MKQYKDSNQLQEFRNVLYHALYSKVPDTTLYSFYSVYGAFEHIIEILEDEQYN